MYIFGNELSKDDYEANEDKYLFLMSLNSSENNDTKEEKKELDFTEQIFGKKKALT